MEIPQEGKYVCKLNGQMVIYEAQTGSLCAAVPCVMGESGFTFKHTMTLVTRDGTIQTRTADTMKEVFGWDGVDPFWLMDASEDGGPMRSLEFEIVGGPETGDKGGLYFKSQWLNPVGGGAKMPETADRRSVLAKYGNKFRALAGAGGQRTEVGGQKAAGRLPGPPAGRMPAATPPPMAPRSAGRDASATATGRDACATTPPATMEAAWAALNEAQTGQPADAVEKLWFDTIARLFPNKSNTDLKPHEWGKLKAELSDYIPM